MTIEIDQSDKIENTSKNTVVAFSNHIQKSVFISAVDKRKLKEIFRQIGKSKLFVYRVFVILIFLLIKNHLKQIERIVIDLEYYGKDKLIRNLLLEEIRKIRSDFSKEDIIFEKIGRKSKAHYVAYGVNKAGKESDKKVTIHEVMEFLIK